MFFSVCVTLHNVGTHQDEIYSVEYIINAEIIITLDTFINILIITIVKSVVGIFDTIVF